MVKNLHLIQETRVWSLGQEDLLEKGMATQSRILAWEIHGQGTLAGYGRQGCKESNTTERLTLFRVESVVIFFFPMSLLPWGLKCEAMFSLLFVMAYGYFFAISQNPITLQYTLCTLSLLLAAVSAVCPDQPSSLWSSRLSILVLIHASTFMTQMFQTLPQVVFSIPAPCDSLPANNNLIFLQSAPSWAQTPPFIQLLCPNT